MDYNKLILANVDDKELLHNIATVLKKEYQILAKALAQGEVGSAALVVGSMEREINLLSDLDKKVNGESNTVNVA